MKPTDKQTANAKRHKARHYAIQALYQWKMSGMPITDIMAEFHVDNDMTKVDIDYFNTLLRGVTHQASALDETIAPYVSDRAMDEVTPVELAILRLATYEFQQHIEVPFKVVVNEAVNFAKKFGAEDSFKFINGVLDSLAKQLRAIEVNAAKP